MTYELESDAREVQINYYKSEIENANLYEISTDVKSKYELIDPSVRAIDLGVLKNAVLNAISKYVEMMSIQTDVKRLIPDYKTAFQQGLEEFKDDGATIRNDILTIMERTYDLDQAYNIFIKFSTKVIKTLVDIVDNTNNPWENVSNLHKVDLIEIINQRLIASADLLKYCNEFQQTVLNTLNSMIDALSDLKANNQVSSFQRFLDKCRSLIVKQRMNLIGNNFWNKISLLLNGATKPQKDQDIYEKRKKYDGEESSFNKAISDWKQKAYHGAGDYDNNLSEQRHKTKKTKFSRN